MTVVLQHQYTGLEVDDEGFAVTLRFGGSWERIRVPFAALTAFLDPSVPFGLDLEQFEAAANLEPDREAASASPREEVAEPHEDELGEPASSEAAPERGADVLPFRPR
jgi:hypothetical protein